MLPSRTTIKAFSMFFCLVYGDKYCFDDVRKNMAGSLSTLLFAFILIGFQYLMEVHGGSSICIRDAEAGVSPIDCTPRKCPSPDFPGMAAPLQLLALGLPLLVTDLFMGGALINAGCAYILSV